MSNNSYGFDTRFLDGATVTLLGNIAERKHFFISIRVDGHRFTQWYQTPADPAEVFAKAVQTTEQWIQERKACNGTEAATR